MRIGQLCDMYMPHISGVTNHIDLCARRFTELGHDVTVVTWGNRDHDDAKVPYRIVRSSGVPWGSTGWQVPLGVSSEARRALAELDVVHAHHPFVSGRLALQTKRRHGTPVVFTNHTRYDIYGQTYAGWVPDAIRDRFVDGSLSQFYSQVDAILSPSPTIADWLERSGLTDRAIAFPNAINTKRFAHPDHPATKAGYGLAEDSILFVYLGRVAEEKNMSFLVSSFIEAASVQPRLALLVVGDGPSRVESESRLTAAGLGDRVRFIGSILYESVPDAIAPADVFVTASVSETYPLVVMEAAAAGMPTLGVDSPGVGEIVRPDVTGILVEENAEQIAGAMVRLATDSALRAQLSRGATEASADFDIAARADELLELYRELSAGRPS